MLRLILLILTLLPCLSIRASAQLHQLFGPVPANCNQQSDRNPQLPERFLRLRIDKEQDRCFLRFRGRKRKDVIWRETFPIDSVKGRKLFVRGSVRHRAATGSKDAGVYRLALHTSTPSGQVTTEAPIGGGNAPTWESQGFATVVPENALACELQIGISRSRSLMDVRDLSILVQPNESFKIHSKRLETATHLRGMMVAPFATADDLRALAGWGANHVRWQLTWGGFPQSPADTASVEGYRAWLSTVTSHIKSLLPLCDTLGIRVLLDLHTLPGGCRYEAGTLAEHRIFSSRKTQQEFTNIWVGLAQMFRDEPAVWGYDLANEPVEGAMPDSSVDWNTLARRTADAIRQVDTTHAIVVQGAPSGGVPAFPGLQLNAADPKTVYSFHIYDPILFTHQGIVTTDTTIRYPGVIGGRYWDRDSLRAWMQPVRDWQSRHGQPPVYIGEFSAVRWAPDGSAARYIADCISLFEGWGWSWAYHAFREWDGWSPEHGPNRFDHEPMSAPTDREILLRAAFQKNRQ